MAHDSLAYIIAICVACFTLGMQLGCIWANRIIQAEYLRNPPPSNRCYDEGYSDASKGISRRWNR
jgi:hypothetical protein